MKDGRKAYIASLEVAVPPFSVEQKVAADILSERTSDLLSERNLSVMRKIFAHPSIRSRSFAVDDAETVFKEDPDSRISRFTKWSVDLSSEALVKALGTSGIGANDISALVVNTCTGYICPGISTYLVERLGLPGRTKIFDLLGGGCGGAIPNLQVSEALLSQSEGGAVASVSVEICSATFETGDNLSLIVSNALFGDGAAASVLTRNPCGLQLLDSASLCIPEDREYIRYIHKNGRLHNQLSVNLHKHVTTAVARVVSDLLSRNSLRIADVPHWALHTGGDKVINSIRDRMNLSEEQLYHTRHVLSEYGNMSSPTVLFVLKQLAETAMRSGELCVIAAFGAGLSAHACLLRRV